MNPVMNNPTQSAPGMCNCFMCSYVEPVQTKTVIVKTKVKRPKNVKKMRTIYEVNENE
jgi:hypothetical protein